MRIEAAPIAFRPASARDFDYCAKLYLSSMETATRPHLEMAARVAGFRERWDAQQVRIVRRDGADIGWLQTATTADALFVAQLFVEPALRRQGVGTEVMRRIIGEAARAGQAVTLGIMKTNPAIRLYERLGFTITHEDGRKFFMRCDSVGPMPDRPGGQKETRRDARHDRASPSGIKI